MAFVTREPGAPTADGSSEELRKVLADDAIRSVYQPIVSLADGEVVGYEALARGPAGSAMATPDTLFAAAGRSGLTLELEWACRAAAFRGAEERPTGSTLFVNVEPSSLGAPEPPALQELADGAISRGPVVLELTERALVDAPSDVLAAVRAARARGFLIAVDDVGVDPASIALLPFVDPEIIKLDLRLVRSDHPQQDVASVVHAVSAVAERTDALVVAEGVETERELRTAHAIGARLGQGWHYGRPGPLPDRGGTGPTLGVPPVSMVANELHASPFALLAERIQPRVATKSLLLSISRYLEHYVAEPAFASVLFASFERRRHFTPRTRARYARLAEAADLVGVFGAGMDRDLPPGVRGVHLAPDDPLVDEWNVAVVTPHIAATLVAQDLGDLDRPDAERRFTYCLTYERELAVQAASMLMDRLAL